MAALMILSQEIIDRYSPFFLEETSIKEYGDNVIQEMMGWKFPIVPITKKEATEILHIGIRMYSSYIGREEDGEKIIKLFG